MTRSGRTAVSQHHGAAYHSGKGSFHHGYQRLYQYPPCVSIDA
jgi:hypothetical protein